MTLQRVVGAAAAGLAAGGAQLAFAAPPAAAGSAIPFKRDASGPAAHLEGGAIGVLTISLLAIGVVLYIRKRLNLNGIRPGAPRLLKVLETQRLGPKALLSVVEFDGDRYLISQGEQGVSCLASKPVVKEQA